MVCEVPTPIDLKGLVRVGHQDPYALRSLTTYNNSEFTFSTLLLSSGYLRQKEYNQLCIGSELWFAFFCPFSVQRFSLLSLLSVFEATRTRHATLQGAFYMSFYYDESPLSSWTKLAGGIFQAVKVR